LAKYILSSFQKEFEDTKGKNRIRNSKTHRQHNAQKIAKHRATLKTEDEHRCSGRVAPPAPVLKGQIFSSYFV
jgi:hypothetical protein